MRVTDGRSHFLDESAYDILAPVKPSGAMFTIQSNGVSVSDDWIKFLRQTETQIGLSIDGPQRFTTSGEGRGERTDLGTCRQNSAPAEIGRV